MDAKTIKDIRQRLSMEYENLIKSNNRKRLAAEEITVENTEDEGDLATISHDRDLLYNLHEGQFRALEIHPASHEGAGPWSIWGMRPLRERHQRETAGDRGATLCIRCQEETEAEHISSRMLAGGLGEDETEQQ
jgi:RNA polymerase-binding transcription factor DksA